MKCRSVTKVVFIGAGPANIFAVLELISLKFPPQNIYIIEKGYSSFIRKCNAVKDCKKCKVCNIVSGFGGAGLFSDGKLEIDRNQKFDRKSAQRVFDHMKMFDLTLLDEKKIEKVLNRLSYIGKSIAPLGLSIHEDFVSQHIGTEEIIKLTKKIEAFLSEQGVNILFETEVHNVVFNSKTETYSTLCTSVNEARHCINSNVIVAGIGKSSQTSFNNIFKTFVFEKVQKPPIIGVRYEFPSDSIIKISNGILKDPLIHWETPQGDEISTYCTCYRGRVVPYFTGEYLLLGGHSFLEDECKVSNFGIAFIAKSQVFEISNDFSYSFAKSVNSYGGNKPVVQTVRDFFNNTQKDINITLNTTLKSYKYGNLNLLLPYTAALSLKIFINKLAKFDEGFLNELNVISAPIIEFVSPLLKTNNNFESKYKNLFFSGETSGRTYGIVSSASSGIMISNAIIHNLNHYSSDSL